MLDNNNKTAKLNTFQRTEIVHSKFSDQNRIILDIKNNIPGYLEIKQYF